MPPSGRSAFGQGSAEPARGEQHASWALGDGDGECVLGELCRGEEAHLLQVLELGGQAQSGIADQQRRPVPGRTDQQLQKDPAEESVDLAPVPADQGLQSRVQVQRSPGPDESLRWWGTCALPSRTVASGMDGAAPSRRRRLTRPGVGSARLRRRAHSAAACWRARR